MIQHHGAWVGNQHRQFCFGITQCAARTLVLEHLLELLATGQIRAHMATAKSMCLKMFAMPMAQRRGRRGLPVFGNPSDAGPGPDKQEIALSRKGRPRAIEPEVIR